MRPRVASGVAAGIAGVLLVLALVLGAAGFASFLSDGVAPTQTRCNARGSFPSVLPDPRCTPGATSPLVTEGTISRTICRPGYSASVRPAGSVTEPEKLASMRRYGDPGPPSAYEYDHLVPLSLGGAPNDPRNLWPEPGAAPNPKDQLERRLRRLVCSGALPLDRARREIASDWVAAFRRYVSKGGDE